MEIEYKGVLLETPVTWQPRSSKTGDRTEVYEEPFSLENGEVLSLYIRAIPSEITATGYNNYEMPYEIRISGTKKDGQRFTDTLRFDWNPPANGR